jgi:dynein heavy chain 1
MKGLDKFLSDIVFCLYGSELVLDTKIIEKFSNPATKYLYVSSVFEAHLEPVSNLVLVVVKRAPILTENESWSCQLQLIHLPDTQDTLSSTLACIVQAMNPILSGDSKSVALAKKKCTELELSLSSLDEAQMPNLNLDVDPQISQLIKDNVSIKDSPLLQDSVFLNRLQGHVNNWIKEIQKVTSLSREVHGSAISEIMFWGNLEGNLGIKFQVVLLNTEKSLQSQGVCLTLEILKYAKRYHVTVSFLSDTGLKEATEKVQKFNLLLRVIQRFNN